jgi:hypothetical protein
VTAILSRDKLAAVLARLESPYDGERAAAALIASKMVRDAGVVWSELLNAPRAADVCQPKPSWQHMAAFCHRRRGLLTEWELRFVSSIQSQATVSKKQWAILARLFAKVTEAAV